MKPTSMKPTAATPEAKGQIKAGDLAVFLAVGHRVDDMPRTKHEMLVMWGELTDGARKGYIARAKRLLEAWG